METSQKEKQQIKWLNGLIMLAQWDENLPLYLARLFKQSDQYKKALELIRARESKVPPAPGNILREDEWTALYKRTTTTGPLRELFADQRDPLAGASLEEISVLADLSDLTTDPQTTFSTRNGTFHQVYEVIRQKPELNTKDQISEGMQKFYMLFSGDKNMAEELYKLACSGDWYLVLASVKDVQDYIPEGNEKARQTLNTLRSKLTTELSSILLKPTNLYRVPPRLVKILWEKNSIFNEALSSIPPAQLVNEYDRAKQVANVAYPLFAERAKAEIDAIAADLQLLAVVARHCISVRKFAKLDGLVSTWPKIATLAMANYAGLLIVERFLTEKPAPPDSLLDTQDARSLLAVCQKDEALVRFFRLQPYFKDIDKNELRQYRPLAVAAVDPTQPAVSTPPPSPSAASASARVAGISQSRVCELKITRLSSAAVDDPSATPTYSISLKVPNVDAKNGTATFSVPKLLEQMLSAIGATSEDALQSVLRELFSGNNGEQILFRAGLQLAKTILDQTDLEALLASALETQEPVRLVIASDDEEIHYLPWEWIPQPSSTELLLANARFSLVRSQLTRTDGVLPPLKLPLKMLGIFPNLPIGAHDSSESVVNALNEVTRTRAQFTAVTLNDATSEQIQHQLKMLSPELLYFEGVVQSEEDVISSATGLDVLLSQGSYYERVALKDFVNPLVDAKVKLFVIGKNETGRVYGNAITPFANRLTQMSLPAVIAPLRAVDVVTASAFINEFYRAFLSGSSLEQSLYTARRKVAAGGGDWSSFALFANPSVLDFFQPLQPSA